jgi:hypothetical protein
MDRDGLNDGEDDGIVRVLELQEDTFGDML